MKTLAELLIESAAHHRHLCPRQVLGVQMGRFAAELLGFDLPQIDKRLLTIAETDGCFTTGVSVATNCWVGRRTLRIEDYGKVAATFVDTQHDVAVRIAPAHDARAIAVTCAPDAGSRWHAMLFGYQTMSFAELFVWHHVTLTTPLDVIIGQPGQRATCERCGEEILNGRERRAGGRTLCRHCLEGGYYQAVS